MLTVAIIPARAGSRGLPGKHLRLLGGEPMIVHTIRAALHAERIDRVIVSTNDPAVARVARRAGAEVPFRRPESLAGDDAPTFPVIRHAVAWLEETGARVDVVVTLQATSPLRDAAEIDATVALLDDPRIRSAVTVTSLNLPVSVVGALADGRFVGMGALTTDLRRQAAAPVVRLTGGVYATRRDLLEEERLIDDRPAVLLVSGGSAIDVDKLRDLTAARRALQSIRRRHA
jgi:CMP-N,N'-diacetyllegionaminic acid synthase